MNDINWHILGDRGPQKKVMAWMVDNVSKYESATKLAEGALDYFQTSEAWIWDMAQDVWDIIDSKNTEDRYAK